TVDGGDGVTSLREAVDQARADDEEVTINLPAGSYGLTHCTPVGGEPALNRSGDLDLGSGAGTNPSPVTIRGAGAGATIDQTCAGRRHLSRGAPTPLVTDRATTIDHVTFTHGKGATAGS